MMSYPALPRRSTTLLIAALAVAGWFLVIALLLLAGSAWAQGVPETPTPTAAGWQGQAVTLLWTLVLVPLAGFAAARFNAWLKAKADDAKCTTATRKAANIGLQLAGVIEPLVAAAEVDLRPKFTADGKFDGAGLKLAVKGLALEKLSPAVLAQLRAHFGELVDMAVSGAIEVAVAKLPPRKAEMLAEAAAAGEAVRADPMTLEKALAFLAELQAKEAAKPATVTLATTGAPR